jgi:hypothetical protein
VSRSWSRTSRLPRSLDTDGSRTFRSPLTCRRERRAKFSERPLHFELAEAAGPKNQKHEHEFALALALAQQDEACM